MKNNRLVLVALLFLALAAAFLFLRTRPASSPVLTLARSSALPSAPAALPASVPASAPAVRPPATPAARVAVILRDYEEMTAQVEAALRAEGASRATIEALHARLALLDRERRADLAPLLSPAEVEAIDLRASQPGRRLRTALADLPVTDDELRALFRLQRAHDEKFPLSLSLDDAFARTAARAALNAAFHATLGDDRFAAYMTREEPDYAKFLALAAVEKLPPSTAYLLWELKQDSLARAAEIAARPGLTPAQRAAAMTAAGQQLEARLASLVRPAALLAADPATFGLLQSLLRAAHRPPR